MNKILFDAQSTNPISDIIAVAAGDCVLINSWHLQVGEVAQVYRVLMELGSIPAQQSGSCSPPPQVTAAAIITETPYFPCNVPVEVGQQANENITSIVLQQPGYYRVYLTPSALGTAYVEAIALTGADACDRAAAACCCTPETWWEGTSLNACLVITPGGSAGHAPIFNLDACCLFNSLPSNPNPVLTDELVFLSGGGCFRATIDEVFSSAIVCDSLGEQPLLPPQAGDQVVGLDAGANCKRMDGETFVEFFETPWTGISTTPALNIAPGGINGHGPTFSYDLCADIQAQASCGCEPNPGDQVLIVQGGACVLANWPTVDVCAQVQALVPSGSPPNPGDEILVLTGGNCLRATWPTVDVCDQVGLLPNGALIAGDTVLVREAGGACKQVLASTIAAGFDGGTINNPIEGPDGACAAPTYSFTSDPSSGMFFDPASPVTCNGNSAVVIAWQNCASRLDVSDSIRLTAQNGDFLEIGCSATISTANSSLTMASDFTIATVGIAEVFVNASNDFIVNAAGSAALNGINGVVLNSDNQDIFFGTNFAARLTIENAGSWLIGGSAGIVGQFIGSNGPGLPPTWQTPAAGGVAEPITQIVYGTGPAVDSSPFLFWDIANGEFKVNENAGGTPFNGPGNRGTVVIRSSGSNSGGTGGDIQLLAADNPDAVNQGRDILLRAGKSVLTDRAGGNVDVRGGNADGPAAGAQGGHVFINGGNSTNGTNPGDVIIRPGTASGGTVAANKGIVELGSGNGWHLRLASKASDGSYLIGCPGNLAGDTGQTVTVQGGTGNAGGVSDGGDVRIGTGIPLGGGVRGRIDFNANQSGFGSPIAHFTGYGDMVMAGYGQGTNGTQDTILLAGATTGFLWPPRITSAPVGVPAGTDIPGGTTYANPMVVEEIGGNITLWIYSFAAAAWRSVTLT